MVGDNGRNLSGDIALVSKWLLGDRDLLLRRGLDFEDQLVWFGMLENTERWHSSRLGEVDQTEKHEVAFLGVGGVPLNFWSSVSIDEPKELGENVAGQEAGENGLLGDDPDFRIAVRRESLVGREDLPPGI